MEEAESSSIFDDRMEIFSPGKLPNLVTLENMSHTRWSRNPVIAASTAAVLAAIWS